MSGRMASDRHTIRATSSIESMLPSKRVLSIASICHEKSPSSSAPTMRPLPLSVWNPRRISVINSVFSCCCNHAGIRSPNMAATDSNSSRNTSSNSGSIVAIWETSPVSAEALSSAGAFSGGGANVTASISPTGNSSRRSSSISRNRPRLLW